MRVALGQVPALTDEYIRYAQQLGVPSIHLNTPALPGTGRWEASDLLASADASRGCRTPPGGDRERPEQLLHGRHARPSRPRRGDRELPGDDPELRSGRHRLVRLPLLSRPRLANVGGPRRPRGRDRHRLRRGHRHRPRPPQRRAGRPPREGAGRPLRQGRALRGRSRARRRRDVGELRVLHSRGDPGGRGGGRSPVPSSGRSTGPDTRRRGPPVPQRSGAATSP